MLLPYVLPFHGMAAGLAPRASVRLRCIDEQEGRHGQLSAKGDRRVLGCQEERLRDGLYCRFSHGLTTV